MRKAPTRRGIFVAAHFAYELNRFLAFASLWFTANRLFLLALALALARALSLLFGSVCGARLADMTLDRCLGTVGHP